MVKIWGKLVANLIQPKIIPNQIIFYTPCQLAEFMVILSMILHMYKPTILFQMMKQMTN